MAVTAVAMLSLAACGGGSSGSGAPAPSPSATAPVTVDPKEPACGFLSAAEREALAGSPVDEVVATKGTASSSQCRWQASTALIQVTTLPAQEWAKTLPQVVAQLETSGEITSAADREELARAKKLLSGAASFSGRQACAAFTTLAEIGGTAKGATTTITTVPITETESGISAQMCTSGEMTSLIYSVPGLEQSATVDAAVTKALTAAQSRAVAAR